MWQFPRHNGLSDTSLGFGGAQRDFSPRDWVFAGIQKAVPAYILVFYSISDRQHLILLREDVLRS